MLVSNSSSRLSIFVGATLLAGLLSGCDDAPCEDTLTCDVGDSASTSSGTGGASSSSSSQTTTSTGGGGDTGVDTTPPTVLSVTPSVDATGVSNTATILVSFSEPMNRVATQNAFQSTTLTGLTFAWPDDQTMEVTPGNLTYAQGGHDVVANEYSYTITTLAADLAGNQLKDNRSWSFSTLREVTDHLPALTEPSRNSSGEGAPCFFFPSSIVGQVIPGPHSCRILNEFDLTPIPPGAQLASASLTCSYQQLVGPTPTSSSLDLVRFPDGDYAAGWGATAVASYPNPFNFGQTIQNPATVDVTAAISAEVASSATKLQFRFRINHSPFLENNYLVWRNASAPTGGCSEGLLVSYVAP